MKSGTFGKDDAPQAAGTYDALRPNRTLVYLLHRRIILISCLAMQPQATGWGGGGFNGSYMGYQQ